MFMNGTALGAFSVVTSRNRTISVRAGAFSVFLEDDEYIELQRSGILDIMYSSGRLGTYSASLVAINNSGDNNFVFRSIGGAGGKVYTNWSLLNLAISTVQNYKTVSIDSSTAAVTIPSSFIASGVGGALSAPVAGIVTFTNPAGTFTPAMVNRGIDIDLAGIVANNGRYLVTAFIDPNTIQYQNANAVAEPAFPGTWLAGAWNMIETELTGVPETLTGLGNTVTWADGCLFLGLQKIGGDLTCVNLNSNPTYVPIRANAGPAFALEVGLSNKGDFPTLTSTGIAGIVDVRALLANQVYFQRLWGSIGGANPAIIFGNSPATGGWVFQSTARFAANMVTGTNVAASIGALVIEGAQFNRQQNFAGSIPSGVAPTLNATPIVGARRGMFPSPVNQAAPVPFTVPATFATGLAWGSVLTFNTTAGNIAQPLPMIRAAAPATGATAQTAAGVLNSASLECTIANVLGANNVNVTPDPTLPDTIFGGAGPFVVGPGEVWSFLSDGVSNSIIVSKYP